MQIWTIQLSQYRRLKEQGIELVDITAKSGITAFAPQYSDVMAYKLGQLTEEQYTEKYLTKLQESFKLNLELWREQFLKKKVAYACYCRAGIFCHRHLFVKFLSDRMKARGIDHTLMSEYGDADGKEITVGPQHPTQPLVVSPLGIVRFKRNKIIDHLWSIGVIDLNHIAKMDFPMEDRQQLAQLIGYSVSGWGSLSYVPEDRCTAADQQAVEFYAGVQQSIKEDLKD